MLQFARPEEFAGNVDYHSPNEAINDTLPLVQHLLNKVRIDLKMDLQADCFVAINRTELQQVLINLIVNAIHAMPDGGTLDITTKNSDRDGQAGALITISDTGVGMPPEVLDRIFDPFFTTKKAEGTGLGLSISQKLVSRSGGHIWVESTLGKGTCFFIFIQAVD